MMKAVVVFVWFLFLGLAPDEVRAEGACEDDNAANANLGALSGFSNEVKEHDLAASVRRLQSLGFVCAKEPEGSPWRCVGKVPGYPKKVAIHIPVHFDLNETDPEIVTHFHGHVVQNDDFSGTLNRYRLDAELHRSGLSRLLIIPESTGKCDTYKTELSTRAQFDAFHHQLFILLKNSGLVAGASDAKAVRHRITGHSGAYRSIGGILSESLQDEKIERVGLFDATYCSSLSSPPCRGLKKFADRFPGKVKSYYLENSPTSEGSELIFRDEDRVKLSQGSYSHLTVMKKNYSDWMRE
ncbi:MAG: hypothetical protein KGP28_00950 [Bdellovibrionales bacterium]|nr:hypothetical protein [Bdellovibrionales bacterium]